MRGRGALRRKRSEKDQALGVGKAEWTGRDLAEGAGLVGEGGVLPLGVLPLRPSGRSPALPAEAVPSDPALTRQGLSEEQRNQEQQGRRAWVPRPASRGSGKKRVRGCSETL